VPISNRGSEAALSERPQCLVVDTHPLVRLGVRGVLSKDFEVQEASGREEALDLVRDIGMKPEISIADGIAEFVAWYRGHYTV